jgi:hypothetical protein
MNSLLLAVLLAAAYFLYSKRTANRHYPPGPKPIPLLGNVFDLTTKELWIRVNNWSRLYGDLIYIHVFGQGLIFCNNATTAINLLEKRGAIYSDKPALIMTGELYVYPFFTTSI